MGGARRRVKPSVIGSPRRTVLIMPPPLRISASETATVYRMISLSFFHTPSAFSSSARWLLLTDLQSFSALIQVANAISGSFLAIPAACESGFCPPAPPTHSLTSTIDRANAVNRRKCDRQKPCSYCIVSCASIERLVPRRRKKIKDGEADSII
jgi:hypothetical protein